MFVRGIEISNHNQFKDFKLDLTYPKGHDFAGDPLRKVCFIGQSGTGKTTLLEEVWSMNSDPPGRSTERVLFDRCKLEFKNDFDYTVLFGLAYNTPDTSPDPNYNRVIPDNPYSKGFSGEKNGNKFQFLSFGINNYETDIKGGWGKIGKELNEHHNTRLRYKLLIGDAYIKGNIEEANRQVAAFKAWQENNQTALHDLAENYLNTILDAFNMEVQTEFPETSNITKLLLANKTTKYTIPMESWSSGVKNIIARTIPLYTHQFKNAIICVDEPENSLYPDIQRKIIDIYTKLAPDSQFFFATHSPIIASSFEPWEIVELKFNEEGYVYRDVYYEGENHVDNYKYYPQYLRWDAILQNIFDLENDGSEARQEMLQDFSDLDIRLKARKAKGEQLSKEDPEVKQLLKMGKKLGWDTK
ncbi:MAG: AAA family ATPase [Aureispira sp.]